MSRRGWILFALLSIVWGLPYLMIKVAVAEIPVPVLVFVRVALAALMLWPIAIRESAWNALAAHWKPLLAFAVLEFAVPWGLLFHAEKSISSSMAGLLMASIPVMTVVLSRMTGDRERIGPLRAGGLAIGLLGVFLLAAPTLKGDGRAIAQVLIAAACYTYAAIIAGRYLNTVPAFSMTAACLAAASLMYAPAAVMAWPRALPSLPAMGSALGLAIFCTALAFVWFFHLIREAGVSRAVLVTYLNPAVAGLAGVFILGEPITSLGVAAFVLIVGGSLMAAAGSARTSAQDDPNQVSPSSSTSSIRPRCPACASGSSRSLTELDG